jgi:hypothetical protein
MLPRLGGVMRTWLLVVLLLATRAQAIDCAKPEGTTAYGVASQSAEARLSYLSKLLDEEGQAARRWTLIWGGSYGLLTVARLGVMSLFPANEQPDWYWGALSTAVGVAFSVLDPLEVLSSGATFAKRAAVATPEETCQLIADGERMLAEGAEHEELGTRWFIHAGNVLFNVGIGLVLGLGYGRWTSGIINAAIGVAIGEATIFSSPTRLISGWKKYRAGEPSSGVAVHVIPTAGPGLGVLVTF